MLGCTQTIAFFVLLWSVYSRELPQPTADDGYLLALKVSNPTETSSFVMYKVSFNGSISKWWEIHGKFGRIQTDAFAFDSQKNVVYLPTTSQITGIAQDGTIVTQKALADETNHQYFWNYFYNSETLSGICSNSSLVTWSWCQMDIKTGHLSRSTNRLPYTDGPNGLDQYEPLYAFDMRNKLIWYGPYIQPFLVGASYDTGKTVFTSGNTSASCVAHNALTMKTYILKGTTFSQLYKLAVFELLPKPKPPKELIKLPQDSSFIIGVYGSCGIVSETNELYVLMTNITASDNNAMPTDLIIADLTKLSYKQVPLDYTKWKSDSIVNAVNYVPPN